VNELNNLDSSVDLTFKGIEAHAPHNFLAESKIDASSLENEFSKLKSRTHDLLSTIDKLHTEKSIQRDLDKILMDLDNANAKILNINFCEEQARINETNQLVREMKEFYLSLNEHIDEIKEKSKENDISQDILINLSMVSERSLAVVLFINL